MVPMLFAAESATAATQGGGWFLEHAWLIPVIPAAAFFVIILFGKKLPMKGAEVGIASMAAPLVLSIGAVIQWIHRVNDAGAGGEGALGAIRALGQGVIPHAAASEEAKAYVMPVIHQWTWFRNGGANFTIGTHMDGLAVTLCFVVSFIAMLVQVYSTEYVRDDRRYTHFFAALTLFAAGMLAMVVAENTIELLLGWEIMGLCSFMLIGHWWEEYPNARAALKAFFTVRVGDTGLLIGIAILYFSSNDWIHKNLGGNGFSIHGIMAWATSGDGSHRVLFWASIALFIAVIGKSGQFPLHTWLPDAMAGPTPVSSLLHSSTMVVAGVFLVARLYPVFFVGFHIADGGVNPMALIGGITIIISGLLALVQVDIKRVLAYSTVGQLGYMIMGLGVGAWTPAVFHIFTHAFFKACLFLGAGSVSHSASHHSFDMKKDMGGIWRKMPITTATFAISTAALMGIFPFAGFFSKDEIIDNAGHNGYHAFMVIGFIGAFLTTAYMSRCFYLTFLGKSRGAAAGEHHGDDHHAPALAMAGAHGADAHGHDAHGHDAHGDAAHDTHDAHGGHDAHAGPHESPWQITLPLVLLSIGALAAGWLNMAKPVHVEKFTKWVEPGIAEPISFFPTLDHAAFEWAKAVPSQVIVLAALIIGFGLSIAVYERGLARDLTRRSAIARGTYAFLWNKYYLDALYEKVIVAGISGPICRAAYWINQNVLDGVVNALGIGTRETGRWVYKNVDQLVVDGIVNGSGAVAEGTGAGLRSVQSGKVQQYGALLFGGAIVGAILLIVTR